MLQFFQPTKIQGRKKRERRKCSGLILGIVANLSNMSMKNDLFLTNTDKLDKFHNVEIAVPQGLIFFPTQYRKWKDCNDLQKH